MNEYAYSRRVPGDKKMKPHKLILLITGAVAALSIIFFLSFSISYNKISADRKLSKNANETIKEQAVQINELKNQLSAKDEEIENLKLRIEKYEGIIADLKDKEQYSKMIAEELNKLPKETKPKQQSPQPSEPNKQSDVQKDIYQKAQ